MVYLFAFFLIKKQNKPKTTKNMNKNNHYGLKSIYILCLIILCLEGCVGSNRQSVPDVTNDYSMGSELETLDGRFAEAQERIREQLPITITEELQFTDIQVTAESVIYCYTFSEELNTDEIDFSEIDKEQDSFMEENIKAEQMQMMMKFCYTTGRNLVYRFLTANEEIVHEKKYNPLNYIIKTE